MGLGISGYADELESIPDMPKTKPTYETNERWGATTQLPLEADPAPSNLLRFSKLPVTVNPGGGLFFRRPCPEDPPALDDPPAHLQGTKVGTCIYDGADVFLSPFVIEGKVVAYRMWTKTKYVADQDVRFNPPHDTLDYRMLKADLIWRGRTIWETVHASRYCQKIREWRRARLIWEMELIETEWECGNHAVFPPGTEDIDVVVAIMDLEHQIEDDDREILDCSVDSDDE